MLGGKFLCGPGGTLGVPKGVSGSLGGALLELLGQRKIIEKPLVFIAFSQYAVQGGASNIALGPSVGALRPQGWPERSQGAPGEPPRVPKLD